MSNFIKIAQETFCDARIEKAASLLKTSKPHLLYDLIQIWMTCQTRKRGVLSTKELAASIICGSSLDVVHALFDTTLLLSPADMRSIVKEEWLTQWALEGVPEVDPQVVVEMFYESTNSIKIANDHYLYVAGSYDCLHWRRSNVENGRKGGLKAAERRRSKAGSVKPGYSDGIATVQPGYSVGTATVQGGQQSAQSSLAIEGVQPGYSGGKAGVKPRNGSLAIEGVQPGYSGGIATVQRGYSDPVAISSEIKPYVYVSASNEAGDTDAANAPEGADDAVAPPTPLDVGAVQNTNPRDHNGDPILDRGMERDAEWFSQVAHLAIARFTMRGRKPVLLKNEKCKGEIERWSAYVAGAYALGAAVSCLAEVEITELRQPSKPLLLKLAKLLVYANPRNGCDAALRVLGAYVQAALLWRETGASYWLPTVDNFLVTQAKYKMLERKEKHTTADYGPKSYCEWGFEFADDVFSGKFNFSLESVFCLYFGGMFQTPEQSGIGKDTIIKLKPIVPVELESNQPAKSEAAVPVRTTKPALESTQPDEPRVTFPQLAGRKIEPFVPWGNTPSELNANGSHWPGDEHWDGSGESDYESSPMN
jgi:hypothetical protein